MIILKLNDQNEILDIIHDSRYVKKGWITFAEWQKIVFSASLFHVAFFESIASLRNAPDCVEFEFYNHLTASQQIKSTVLKAKILANGKLRTIGIVSKTVDSVVTCNETNTWLLAYLSESQFKVVLEWVLTMHADDNMTEIIKAFIGA